MTASMLKAVLLGLFASSLLTGCIVIPLDYYVAGSRTNLKKETEAVLKKGENSKEDVLMLLGEPDYCSDDGLVLGYRWSKIYWIAAEFLQGTSASGGKIYWLEIGFDADKRVARTEIHEKSWSY